MRRVGHDARIVLLASAASLPAVVIALLLLGRGGISAKVQWTGGVLVLGSWLVALLMLRERVVRPLRTFANLLAAIREGDFSIRGRHAQGDDALAAAMSEVNSLVETLRQQRLGALEATALLGKVMTEIDVAVFAFCEGRRLRLVNRAGAALLGQPEMQLLGKHAQELGLADLLAGEAPRTVDAPFAGRTGPWELHRTHFRQEGIPHELIVLTDLERALREEERAAWQRLVRVLGHEINNSLAPIHSLASNLLDQLRHQSRPPEGADDMARGLSVIARRAEALGRFMASYARLARLPPPELGPVDVAAWVRRVVELEKRLPVAIEPGPPLTVQGDGDQLDQVLINLVQNAVDAALETGGGVRVRWSRVGDQLELSVDDDGPGIANTSNLFVPFFTTKPGGSGIGLALSRQIAQAHRGSLALHDRGGRGCRARLCLPLAREARMLEGQARKG